MGNRMSIPPGRASTVKSSEANVEKLIETVGHDKVYALFDCVITAPNIDVGGLEIVHGVAPDDRVIVNPSDLITTGQPVPVQQADRTGVKS